MSIFGIIQWVGYFHVSRAFWEYLNSLSLVTVMIYIAKIHVSLYQCVLETLDRTF